MPRPTLVTTTTTPPMPVIQRAYEAFYARTPTTVYHADAGAIGFVFTVKQQTPALQTGVEDWLKFQRLVTQWARERGAMSSITEAAMCPGYQGIIGMGPVAVPFILAQLEDEGDEPNQWFWALKIITGADPVRDEDRGNFLAMAASWLDWGQREGYAR